VFTHAPPAPNTSPLDGFQHFGEVEIDGRTRELTVHLRDGRGTALWSATLTPRRP
jgi:alkaline phosphatase D